VVPISASIEAQIATLPDEDKKLCPRTLRAVSSEPGLKRPGDCTPAFRPLHRPGRESADATCNTSCPRRHVGDLRLD